MIVGLVLVLLPWWRNHDILRDFYDYGLVMAGAGRINAGERPYVDFLTPIQTWPLLLPALAERIGGARYLIITAAQAAWLAAMFAGLAALLWRKAGPALALTGAAAVVMASAGQHTIPWHNAMGVTWIAVVAWVLAEWPERTRARHGVVAMAAVALWLSGMTKVNFHAAALAFALLFVLRGAGTRALTPRQAGGYALVLMGAGVLLPPLTEMAWTGADWATWKYNVLGLAAGSRAEMLVKLLEPANYLRPPHDYYGPTRLPFTGLWIVLSAIATFVATWARRKESGGMLLLLAGVGGALASGLVLLVTNQDIGLVGAGAALAMMIAVLIAFGGDATGGLARPARIVLALASVSLLVPAWWCAWEGARALWGRGPIEREKLTTAENLPPAFDYVRGLRMSSGWRDSLDALAKELAAGERPRDGYFFIHGTEWLVRIVPEAVHRGLPLWLHYGTSYSETARQPLGDFLEDRKPHTVIADRAWDIWFAGLDEVMVDFYHRRELGPLLFAHTPIPEARLLMQDDPIGFVTHLGSNIFSPDIDAAGASVRLVEVSSGDALMSRRSHTLAVGPGFYRLGGEFIATEEGKVRMQVLAGDAESPDVLWDDTVVSSRQEEKVVVFNVSPGGRPVRLRAEVLAGRPQIGWRRLQTSHAGPSDSPPPGPIYRWARPLQAGADWAGFLFAPGSAGNRQLVLRGDSILAEVRDGVPELFCQVPGEIWFPAGEGVTQVSGEFGFRPPAWLNENALPGGIFLVLHYKSGRFQELFRRNLHPRANVADRAAHSFHVGLPEPGGWVGLVVLPASGEENGWGHAWWRGLRAR